MKGSPRLRALILIAPLLFFLGLFFVWPLITVITQSVSDPAVSRVLPRTADLIGDWDGEGAPSAEIQAAFRADIVGATDDQAVGDVTRRLNSSKSGFRSLMGKTVTAVRENPDVDLAEVDKRWADPAFWKAIQDNASPYTDSFLLAAVDMERDSAGSVVAMKEGTSANFTILMRTLWTSALVMLCCLVIGLPYAMIAASVTGWKRAVLLGAVLLPLWTSLLVRTAAWMIILQDNGIINQVLTGLGITSGPLALIYNRFGVVLAMTHVLLPFMVLPIYSVLITVPGNLMSAAASLGAHPIRAFLRVLLPLSLRGVISGALLVFMTSIGYYITPALLGGAGDQMISSVIAEYATRSANWSMAAAIGLILLVLTLALYAVYNRLSRDPIQAR
ncbi:ABC transporter permease [Xinfangfangia sp. D13-10-4-6]|uniref:ABC transporter permease n=1 Tax=Pseudogemmobacter hezensis TaxID=2737662 RepID=UPI001552DCFC|nr:ABC transporter permease [Pseudogemmobacter hezensis]NPD14310.1 ABC transporter permease [Pseudogemmobacter hezensis]